MNSISQKAFIELIKIGLKTSKNDFDFNALSEEDWQEIFIESKCQAVALWTLEGAKDFISLIPTEIYDKWFKFSVCTIYNNHLVINAHKELYEILSKERIEYVILKGGASAYYYPDYSKRASGDIDFLVEPKNFPVIIKALTNAGYKMEMENSDLHIVFKKNNIVLELHEKCAGMPEDIPGELAKEYMQNIFATSIKEKNGLIRPNDSNHALIILFHTIYHMFSGGMGIRHLCDWACFVNKTYNEGFWIDELLPLFEKMGLYKFVMALTACCIDYLNISVPIWFVRGDKALSDEIFQKVLTLGNFGKKNPKRLKHYTFESANGQRLNIRQKISVMFDSLNKTNKKMYPILNKAPYLYPFIMVWRILKYIFLSLCGKKTTLNQRNKFNNERTELFERFEIYRGVKNE